MRRDTGSTGDTVKAQGVEMQWNVYGGGTRKVGWGWDHRAGTRTCALGILFGVGVWGFQGKVTAGPTGGLDGDQVLQ